MGDTILGMVKDQKDITVIYAAPLGEVEIHPVFSTSEAQVTLEDGVVHVAVEQTVEQIDVDIMTSDVTVLLQQVSADTGNVLTVGTDGKLFAPEFSWTTNQW